MQTFLPYKNFDDCAKVLDNKRLGKQRVETLQLLQCINGQTDAWKNHPVTLMWKDHQILLASYGLCICNAWQLKGFNDSCAGKIFQFLVERKEMVPSWLGDERLHSSHRAALLAKNPAHYRQFGWKEKPKVDYFWPITKDNYKP